MAFQPIVALHKSADGKIIDAGAFDYGFKLNDWLKSLDVRPGDRVEFGDKAVREDTASASLSLVAGEKSA
jgi:hypothetical protein